MSKGLSLPVVDVLPFFDMFLIAVHGVTSHPPTVRSGSTVGGSFCHLTWRNLNGRLPPVLAVDSLWTHKNSDTNGLTSSVEVSVFNQRKTHALNRGQ